MFSFHEALQCVKDILFPLFCISCKQEGTILCETCNKQFLLTGHVVCPVFDTSQNNYLTSHSAIFPYVEGELFSKLLFAWKYDGIQDIESVFGQAFKPFFSVQQNFLESVDMMVPVPLHKKRYIKRGFNQAEMISQMLSSFSRIPVYPEILIRTKNTEQQAKLKKHERQKNVLGAFVLKKPEVVRGKNILLVDDVFTTGATMNECARVLQAGGAREVHGFSLAQGNQALVQK